MKQFLNRFMAKNKHLQRYSAEDMIGIFTGTIGLVDFAWGDEAFRPQRALNAAVYDSVMVGIARRLAMGPIKDLQALKEEYAGLLATDEYVLATERATAREYPLRRRVQLAIEAFAGIE